MPLFPSERDFRALLRFPLIAAFPDVPIRWFALVCRISHWEIETILLPTTGQIRYLPRFAFFVLYFNLVLRCVIN